MSQNNKAEMKKSQFGTGFSGAFFNLITRLFMRQAKRC